MENQIDYSSFNLPVLKKQRHLNRNSYFLLPNQPKQKNRERRCSTTEISSLNNHSVSNTSGNVIPAMKAPDVYRQDLSEPPRNYFHSWAPDDSSGHILMENCINFMNGEIRRVLVLHYGERRYAAIMKCQKKVQKRYEDNIWIPIQFVIKNFMEGLEKTKELYLSIRALRLMQDVKVTVKSWHTKFYNYMENILCECQDYDRISFELIWNFETIFEGLLDKLYQMICFVLDEDIVYDTMSEYWLRLKFIMRNSQKLLNEKKNRYGNSGRFLYQYVEDSVTNLCSIHPCNFEEQYELINPTKKSRYQ